MQPGRPPGSSGPSLKDVLLWTTIFLPAFTAALQQQPAYNAQSSRRFSVGERQQQQARGKVHDSLYPPDPDPRGFRDTYVDTADIDGTNAQNENKNKKNKNKKNARTPIDERALATLSPTADGNEAVRAPPAPERSPASSAGITSRQSARSLQEYEVEDIILLATVDGKIHARDRTTGASRWSLENDKPMVETEYHRHNTSIDEHGVEQADPLWIVEPSQDGSIYVYAPGSGFGMQRLGYTVKQLAELAPYASEGTPAVVYTARKSSTLYTIDAATGIILKMFSSDGSITNNDRTSCRRVNPLEAMEEDECETIGTLMLSQTHYTIGIQDRNTGEQISTLHYFEWGPNNHDQDLRSQNSQGTIDNKYVYTQFDGTVFGLDVSKSMGRDHSPSRSRKPTFRQKLSAPVARVYDVVRPYGDTSSDASLIILPQPMGPAPNDYLGFDAMSEDIFVNCTETGSWYAFSESKYPTVTKGAKMNKWYGDDMNLPTVPMSKRQRERFTGVHRLSNGEKGHAPFLIEAPEVPLVGEPPPSNEGLSEQDLSVSAPVLPLHQQPTSASVKAFVIFALLGLVTWASYMQGKVKLPKLTFEDGTSTTVKAPKTIEIPASVAAHARKPSRSADSIPEPPTTPKVREHEPAQETIFPHEHESPSKLVEEDYEVIDGEGEEGADGVMSRERTVSNAAADGTPKHKKKATRGKRSGKKEREKQEQKKQKQLPIQPQDERQPDEAQAPQAEVISVAASESLQVSGALKINSLVINTDEVIGQGSCGTSVFNGTFEGRDVAVKRMLSQYYELASQEVSFLQQSDDHPNVIRYFCQQKDDHFLYIAVELCQASLFEVWDTDKVRPEPRQQQLRALKLSIQQDVPRTLQQLAAGLAHLHNLRIIHRDIKPQNILVAFPKKHQNTGPRLVISDFGLGKNLPENVSTLIDPTGNAGTSGWKAPELISQPSSKSEHSQNHTNGSTANSDSSPNGNGTTSGVKRAADIFSLGCLFFWVLTDGIHPFEDDNGWTQLRELNIKRDHKKMDVLAQWSDAYEPMQLITSMLEHQPENRPTALQVLNHPFFWSPEKRLAFLCDCSDHFEREPRGAWDEEPPWYSDSYHLQLLEYRAEEIIGSGVDFLSKLDRHFVDTLGRQRKYSGNRVLDLLRALRNKKNHYEDMSEDVKRRVGSLPTGYLAFWCHRFPRLLMACYDVVHECGIERSDRFKGYFALGQN